MFKRFLMENAHRDHIKNLYRWWNGQVFSFEMSGNEGKKDEGQDSGMEEAEAALNSDEEMSSRDFTGMKEAEAVLDSDEELSGREFADGIEDWYGSNADHSAWPLQNSHSADLPANIMQLTISDDGVAAHVQAVASSYHTACVRELNLTLSESLGAHNLSSCIFYVVLLLVQDEVPSNIPGPSKPRPQPRKKLPEKQGPSCARNSAAHGDTLNNATAEVHKVCVTYF